MPIRVLRIFASLFLMTVVLLVGRLKGLTRKTRLLLYRLRAVLIVWDVGVSMNQC
jgi:hypothetical protein